MILKGKSGADGGREYAARFEAYVEERQASGTLPWAAGGKLNRSTMANELGFGRDVFRTNPVIAERLAAIEGDAQHVSAVDEADERAAGARSQREAVALEKVKELQERLATSEEECRYLKNELRKLGYVDLILPDVGRMPW